MLKANQVEPPKEWQQTLHVDEVVLELQPTVEQSVQADRDLQKEEFFIIHTGPGLQQEKPVPPEEVRDGFAVVQVQQGEIKAGKEVAVAQGKPKPSQKVEEMEAITVAHMPPQQQQREHMEDVTVTLQTPEVVQREDVGTVQSSSKPDEHREQTVSITEYKVSAKRKLSILSDFVTLTRSSQHAYFFVLFRSWKRSMKPFVKNLSE